MENSNKKSKNLNPTITLKKRSFGQLWTGENAYFSHFIWNLKFKFATKVNYFIYGFMTFLSFLFAFLAAHAIKTANPKEFQPQSLLTLSISFMFVIIFAILFLVISTSSHTSEEKNSRAMEIILSSVGVKYHWFVKLLTNFIWFISFFIGIIIIGSIASFIAGLATLGVVVTNGGMIVGWIAGLSENMKWLVNHNHAITFKYFWNHAEMAHSYAFFWSMLFITIAINGIIYSIITLALSSFIVNSGESLMIVLLIILFPIIFSIIVGLIAENPTFTNKFLCYFPLTSIYNIPSILFEGTKPIIPMQPTPPITPEVIVWTSVIVNIFYIGLTYYFFQKLYIIGVLNYSSNKKVLRRIFGSKIFSSKKIKK